MIKCTVCNFRLWLYAPLHSWGIVPLGANFRRVFIKDILVLLNIHYADILFSPNFKTFCVHVICITRISQHKKSICKVNLRSILHDNGVFYCALIEVRFLYAFQKKTTKHEVVSAHKINMFMNSMTVYWYCHM